MQVRETQFHRRLPQAHMHAVEVGVRSRGIAEIGSSIQSSAAAFPKSQNVLLPVRAFFYSVYGTIARCIQRSLQLASGIFSLFTSKGDPDWHGGNEAEGYAAQDGYDKLLGDLKHCNTLGEFSNRLAESLNLNVLEHFSSASELEMQLRQSFQRLPLYEQKNVQYEFWNLFGRGDSSLPPNWAENEILRNPLDNRFRTAVSNVLMARG